MRRFRFAPPLTRGALVAAVAVAFALGLAIGQDPGVRAAVGDALKIGKPNNAAGKVTSLVADAAGPVLRLVSKGQGAALDLDVKPGAPPLTVPANAGKATNLNADRLDGFDAAIFARANTPTYEVQSGMSIGVNGSATANSATCDGGDRLLAGGFRQVTDSAVVTASSGNERGWLVGIRRTGGGDASASVHAVCLDFPPLRGANAGKDAGEARQDRGGQGTRRDTDGS